MKIAILTFDGFNELDSLVALGLLNFAKDKDWQVSIASPEKRVTSMTGHVMEAQMTLDDVNQADVVLVGSGMKTRQIVEDQAIMGQIKLDPSRQLIGSQCSGALVLAKLGVLSGIPACTDLTTTPFVREAGVEVLDKAFHVSGNIATAGGCLSSQYLVAWLVARLRGLETAKEMIHYVAPIGEKEEYVERALRHILEFVKS